MEAWAIAVDGDAKSWDSWRQLEDSWDRWASKIDAIHLFSASAPETVESEMADRCIAWTYPWEEEEARWFDGVKLRLHPYKTRDPLARMACFMSHYRLWDRCAEDGRPILILEDDAEFIRRFDPTPVLASPFQVVGINDPRKATRFSSRYHQAIQSCHDEICEVPWIDDPEVPQGLAGASAYVMKPEGAKAAIELVRKYGAWPNDAILCKQLMPGMLGQTRTYYTKVQGRPSSLS